MTLRPVLSRFACALALTLGLAAFPAIAQQVDPASLEQVNALRLQAGLPQLSGSVPDDLPVLDQECQAGVVFSCQLGVNYRRGAEGLPSLHFADPAHDVPLLTSECQAGNAFSCSLLQLQQQQLAGGAQAPAQPPAGAPGAPVADPTGTLAMLDALDRSMAEMTQLNERCHTQGDQAACAEWERRNAISERGLKALEMQTEAQQFGADVTESNRALEERMAEREEASHDRLQAEQHERDAEYWARQAEGQRAADELEKASQEREAAEQIEEQLETEEEEAE